MLLTARATAYKLGFHNPLPGLIMDGLSDWYKPVDQCAQIVYPFVHKRKEKIYSPNTHAHEPVMLRVRGHKNRVVPWIFTLPQWSGTDVLMAHASSTTKIARCIVPCNGWVVYENSTIELWTVAEWHSHWVEVDVQVLLVKEESPYQRRELRLIDMGCELGKIFRIVTFYKNDLDVDMILSAVSNSPAVTASVTIFMTRGPVTAPWSSLPSSWITGNGGGRSPRNIIVV